MRETFIYVDFSNAESLEKFKFMSGISEEDFQESYVDTGIVTIMFSVLTGDVVMTTKKDGTVEMATPFLDIAFIQQSEIEQIFDIIEQQEIEETEENTPEA